MAMLSKGVVASFALFGSAQGSTDLASPYSNAVTSGFTGTGGAPGTYQMLVFAKNSCPSTNSNCPTSGVMAGVQALYTANPLITGTISVLQTSADLVLQKAAVIAPYSTDGTNFNKDLGNAICTILGMSGLVSSSSAAGVTYPYGIGKSMFSALFDRSGATAVSATDAANWAKFMSQLGGASSVDTTNVKVTGLSLIALKISTLAPALGVTPTPRAYLVLGGMVTPEYTGNSILASNLYGLNSTAAVLSSLTVSSSGSAVGDILTGLACVPSSSGSPIACTGSATQAAPLAVGAAINTAYSISMRGSGFLVGYLSFFLKSGSALDSFTLARLFSNSWSSSAQALDLAYSFLLIGNAFRTTDVATIKNAQAAMMWMFTNSTYVFPVSSS